MSVRDRNRFGINRRYRPTPPKQTVAPKQTEESHFGSRIVDGFKKKWRTAAGVLIGGSIGKVSGVAIGGRVGAILAAQGMGTTAGMIAAGALVGGTVLWVTGLVAGKLISDYLSHRSA